MSIVEGHDIPREFWLALNFRLQLCWNNNLTNPSVLCKYVNIKLIATTLYAYLASDSLINRHLLSSDPQLLHDMTALLAPEAPVPVDIKTTCLQFITALCKLPSKLPSILEVLNVNANHGLVAFLLRDLLLHVQHPGMREDQLTYDNEFVDAFVTLLSVIVLTQHGGNAVLSADIIPTLVQFIPLSRESVLKISVSCISQLDSLLYSFPDSYSVFFNANGLSIIIDTIKNLVEIISSSTEIVKLDLAKTKLKALLKMMMHLMQTSGTADGIRNLIDSSLPSSIKRIIESPDEFTHSLYSLSMLIMGTFIHNEPTSLTILQEAGLPQSFLASIQRRIPASANVISSLPHVFGAVCLNTNGLHMFTEAHTLETFFSIFTDPSYSTVLAEEGVSSMLGAAVDELVRHHPSLKPIALNCILQVLDRIVAEGKSVGQNLGNLASMADGELDKCFLFPYKSIPTSLDEEPKMMDVESSKPACRTVVYIEFIANVCALCFLLFLF